MKQRRFSTRSRGAVIVEYSFLLLFFGVPVMAGLAAMGNYLMSSYTKTREQIIAPFP